MRWSRLSGLQPPFDRSRRRILIGWCAAVLPVRGEPPFQVSHPMALPAPKPPVIPPGQSGRGRREFRLHAAGHDWTYTVQVPAGPAPMKDLPVVLVLHGSGGQGSTMLERAGWSAKADQGRFLAVAPDAVPSNPLQTPNFWINPRIWNAGQIDPASRRARIDDTEFFRQLLLDLERRFPIDLNRIYVTGHSSGAAMTFKLAAELSDRFAAIAPVSSVCWIKKPRPVRPLPTLMIFGTSDPLVPIQGGESVLPWGKRNTPPVAETLHLWAAVLGCPSRPRIEQRRQDVQYFVYGPGRDQVTLTAYFVQGQGHNWPGGKQIVPLLLGPENHRFQATDVIWDFFQNCQRVAADQPATLDGRRLEQPLRFVR